MSAYLFNSCHVYGYRHRKHHTSTLESSPASQTCYLPFPSVNLTAMQQHFSDVSYIQTQQTKQNPSEFLSTCLSFLTLLSWFCIENKIKLFLFLIFFYQCLCLDLRHHHPLLLWTNALGFPLGSQLILPFYSPSQNISLVMLFNPAETVALLCFKPCSGSPLPFRGNQMVFCLHSAPAPPATLSFLRGMFSPCDLRAHGQPPVRMLSTQMPSF